MEAQIKEETKEASLCFETSGDNLASLSLIEKYDRFIQNETQDVDSDGDFFPDDTLIREEYDQLTNDAANYKRVKNHRLSTGLPSKFRMLDPKSMSQPTTTATTTEHQDEQEQPGPGNGTSISTSTEAGFDIAGQLDKTRINNLNELIEKLAEVRHCEPDGNSIFCTESELESIQERYGLILDFLHDNAKLFDKRTSSKDSENEEQVDVDNSSSVGQSEDMRLLTEKILSVKQTKDKFYEIEQQVREQVEQLELVERYKMESVG